MRACACWILALVSISATHRVSHADDSNSIHDVTQSENTGFKIIPRSVWLARPPTGVRDTYPPPAYRVIVLHTATHDCSNVLSCARVIMAIQDYHINVKKWFDIGYNFLIGGDGNVYEGRGWRVQGAHTLHHNNYTVGVAFIGDFQDRLPNEEQLEAFQRLVSVGVEMGEIKEDYSLVAHCQLSATMSPGKTLAYELTNWPHFDASVPFPFKCI